MICIIIPLPAFVTSVYSLAHAMNRLVWLCISLTNYFICSFWRMDCVPACGGNGNSLDVSCSRSSLHRQGTRERPRVGTQHEMVDQFKNALKSKSSSLCNGL